MSTQQSAQVYVTNATAGCAAITLHHNNSTNGNQMGMWPNVPPGSASGPPDCVVQNRLSRLGRLLGAGAESEERLQAGRSRERGTHLAEHWKECQLHAADTGRAFPSPSILATFGSTCPRGGCQAGMNNAAPYSVISHVFVVMLENHSFNNVFALSGIPGIIAATRATPTRTTA